jgi:hypothetical protein
LKSPICPLKGTLRFSYKNKKIDSLMASINDSIPIKTSLTYSQLCSMRSYWSIRSMISSCPTKYFTRRSTNSSWRTITIILRSSLHPISFSFAPFASLREKRCSN